MKLPRGLLNRQPVSLSLAHISLLFVGLMWVLPFLYYRHAYPLTTFYQEWGAAIFGICALSLLVTQRYWQQPEIPRIVMLPIGLMLLVLVQYVLGKVTYFDQVLLFALYMLWASLLMMLGHRLREEFGLPALAATLAVFLLLGGESSALLGVLQHYRWHTWLDGFVVTKTSVAVFGNLAQPNHFADYVTLGLASLGLLYVRRLVPAWAVILLAVPLLFVLPLSGSRSTWLYLLWMVGMAFLWQRRDKSVQPLLRYSLLVLLGFGLMHGVVQLPWLAGASGSETSIQRMFGEVSSGGIRLHIWREAWLIFTQFPLLGAGFGQFAWQHFLLGPQLHNTSIAGIYNNAHNLVMQLAAEMGFAGLLVLFGTLLPWLWQARKAGRSVHHWWGYAVLAVLGIHSLLEYPLWYAYFIGIAALTLGMLDNTSYRLELRGLGRLSVAAFLLLGLVSLFQLLHGYRNLETLLALRPQSAKDQAYMQRVHQGLIAAEGQAMLGPYAELFIDSMVEVNSEHLADKLAWNERVMHFIPMSPVVYRQALLLALAGEFAASQQQTERAIWAYPAGFPAVLGELRELARKDPAHFAALLEFALRKYEEYQSAVRAK